MSDLERKELKRNQKKELTLSLIAIISLSMALTTTTIGVIIYSLGVIAQRNNGGIGGEIFIFPLLTFSFLLGMEIRKNYEMTRKESR